MFSGKEHQTEATQRCDFVGDRRIRLFSNLGATLTDVVSSATHTWSSKSGYLKFARKPFVGFWSYESWWKDWKGRTAGANCPYDWGVIRGLSY